MKKIFFFFAMFANVAASAQRTIPVSIANTKVDYSTKTVTFDLSWKGSDANHRDEVWIFVDIQPVTGVNILGSWSPATLVPSATTVTTAGSSNQYTSLTHTVESGNTRGVWIKGTSSVTTNILHATVKVTLTSTTPAKFNACAFATDYPPNAVSYSGGSYTFKGTKPFIINGTPVDDTKFAVTKITSLTDATGCPGGVGRDEIHNSGVCAPGLTAVGTYCRDLAADGAAKFIACGYELEVEIADRPLPGSWSTALNCPAGWTPATPNQLSCLWKNSSLLKGYSGYVTGVTCGGGWKLNAQYCCNACSGQAVYLTGSRAGDSCLGTCALTDDGIGTFACWCDSTWPHQRNAVKCVR
ncbi:MAG: hypothetical protein LBU42_03810 [Prevotellaceae bacterium]|jgi:archaellum component FlaF (FlaF/FlaG flagellin family)|nr:hypothetical protein [Prevotellaceae bacterium]